MKYSKEILSEAVKDSITIADVLRKLGLKLAGGNHSHISKKIKKFNIDTAHMLGRSFLLGKPGVTKKPWQDILYFRENSDHRQSTVRLRRALIESGREYKCEKCGLVDEWQKDILRLQIDHINRKWTDDRAENLRFLCPNCHSQTHGWNNSKGITGLTSANCPSKYERFSNCKICKIPIGKAKSGLCMSCYKKSIRKVPRPTKEELQVLIWSKPTSSVAKEIGVSDKAVEKWCKQYGIDKPPRGYWAKQMAEYANGKAA